MSRLPFFLSVTTLLTSSWAFIHYHDLNPAILPAQVMLTAPLEKTPTTGTMEVPQELLYQGDLLNLRFSTPHGAYLAIKDPKGRFFYIIFPAEHATAGLKPLITSEKFVQRAELQMRTDKLTGDPYTYGIDKNQPVFTLSGTYTLIMGDNLAVDNPDELVVRQVKYRHEKRPVAPASKKEGGDPAVAAAIP